MRMYNSQGPEWTTTLSTGWPWWLSYRWTSTKLMSGLTSVMHSVRSMDYIFRWIGEKILMLGGSQMRTWFLTWFSARFSHWDPLTLLHVRSKVRINLRFSHEWEPIMRSSFIFYIDIFVGEPNMFSHRIYIQFSESLRQLVLLLFICYISYALLLATSYSVYIFQF
jgi:hypothetical protein